MGSAFVNAFWVATSETPEWIAARTDALRTQLGEILGVTHWATARGDRWQGDLEALVGIVRRHQMREHVAEGVEGDSLPGEGYSMVLLGAGSSVRVNVSVHAGSVSLGGRIPSHDLHIELRETSPGGLTSDVGDAVCAAVASAWRPATLTLTDTATNRLARRGGWKIGAGYRTWISSEVGTIGRVADGLTATELAGGTLISAPDDWSAEQVVAAMTETLSANGLDEVPR